MFNRIVFFELRHYGDLHITRNFVRYVMENIPANEYVYVLECDSHVLSDFDNIRFEVYDPIIHPFFMYDSWKIIDDTLYVNTSCGTNNMSFFQGTRIQTAYAIFKHYLKQLCNHNLTEDISVFVPFINFERFDISSVESFMSACEYDRAVMFVNGETQSGQVLNFDMYPVLQILAAEFSRILFLVSNPIESLSYRHGTMLCKEQSAFKYHPGKNIKVCKDILSLPGNDIVETSYFTHFCELIVGRSSGVYTLSIERNNIVSNPKKFVCFSHYERDKDLGTSEIFPDLKDNFVWSNNYNYSSMLDIIRNQLG